MQKGGWATPLPTIWQRVGVPAYLLFAADFFADDFLAVDFFALVAAPFLAAVDLFADFFALVAAPFLAAVDLFADFFATGMFTSFRKVQDAMRFRRRRSLALIPPHTPYRSSRRSA